jgi:hypothetical protein
MTLSAEKSKREEALILAKKLREILLNEDKKVSTLLMGCLTVCRYLAILDENKWIEEELNGYDVSKFKNYGEQDKGLPDYRRVAVIFYDIRNNPLVGMNTTLSEDLTVHKMPNPVSEFETSQVLTITGGPMLDIANHFCKENNLFPVFKAVVHDNYIHAILFAIRKRIAQFLDEIILELEYGDISDQIFENVRKQVDSEMVSICPDAINKLQVTYENVISGTSSESWSHVASTCRRIIKDVADVLFPAQSKPISFEGKEYRVDDGAYINRILTGIKEKSGSGTTFEFTKSMFDYVDAFLRNIQKYASKGDHSKFTKIDASRCLVYTYLLLGDILNYYIQHKK